MVKLAKFRNASAEKTILEIVKTAGPLLRSSWSPSEIFQLNSKQKDFETTLLIYFIYYSCEIPARHIAGC